MSDQLPYLEDSGKRFVAQCMSSVDDQREMPLFEKKRVEAELTDMVKRRVNTACLTCSFSDMKWDSTYDPMTDATRHALSITCKVASPCPNKASNRMATPTPDMVKFLMGNPETVAALTTLSPEGRDDVLLSALGFAFTEPEIDEELDRSVNELIQLEEEAINVNKGLF